MREPLLGPLESKVMNYFWRNHGYASIPSVHHFLRRHDKLAYTTVATVITRLVDKSLLSREKFNGEYLYRSCQSRDEFKTERSRNLVKMLLGSFGDLAIASFVAEVKTDPRSLRKLREMTRGR